MPRLPGNAAHFPLVGLWGQHSLMLGCCDSWGMLAEEIGSSVPLLLNLTPSPPLPSSRHLCCRRCCAGRCARRLAASTC